MYAGIDLGKAYDIPGHLANEPFYPAVVLKVSIYIQIKSVN